MKNIVLPLFAFTLALAGIGYSGCQESKADSKATGAAIQIREDIATYQQLLTELKTIHDQNVKAYGEEMGVTSSSIGLEQISLQNEILEKNRLRLEYHRLQLIQADTTNVTRNTIQLNEIAADIANLKTEGEIIKSGIGENVNTRVPE